MEDTTPEEDPMEPSFGDILTITQLARYLQISTSTLYKLAREGKIPGQKIGRHWRFHKETIDRWLGAMHGETARRQDQ